jgi:hypothetical protein
VVARRRDIAMTMSAPTSFDDLDPFAVLRAKDIAERSHVDQRSVRAIARGELPASRARGLRVSRFLEQLASAARSARLQEV